MPTKIAYIMSRFPLLSETFILREMIALQEVGWDISVHPLLLERTNIVHEEALPWVSKLNYVPWMSWGVFFSNVKVFYKNPVRYFLVWATIVLGNLMSPGFLARAMVLVPKAVHMSEYMKRSNVDHIHAHYATHPSLVAWVIHQLSGISYSVTVHAHDIFVDRSMLDTKLKDAAFVVAISEFNRDFLIHHIGEWVAEKIHVIHCGIDTQKYEGRKQPLKNGKYHVLSIGSLQPYKGMKYLIDACALLRDRGLPVSCKIVGGGEEYESLMALVTERSLQDHVELVGAKTQNEVACLLQEANYYVQPSVVTPSGKMEGIPVALMEALAAKLPVVASNLSGIPELIRENETGLLVPPADPVALANSLELLFKNMDVAENLAANGYILVRKEFEIQKNVAQLAGLFSARLGKVKNKENNYGT